MLARTSDMMKSSTLRYFKVKCCIRLSKNCRCKRCGILPVAGWLTFTDFTDGGNWLECLDPDDGGPTLVRNILAINQLDALISQIYFWNRTLLVSDSFSVHHQESSTVHTAIHTGYADCLLAGSQHNLYVLLCVQC